MRRVTFVLFALAGLAAASSSHFTARAYDGPNDAKLAKLLAFEPEKPAAADGELRKLLKERYAAAWNELSEEIKLKAQNVSNADATSDYDQATRLVTAFLALDPKPADRTAILKSLIEFARAREAIMKKLWSEGAGRMTDVHRASYYRLDAEIMLAKEQK